MARSNQHIYNVTFWFEFREGQLIPKPPIRSDSNPNDTCNMLSLLSCTFYAIIIHKWIQIDSHDCSINVALQYVQTLDDSNYDSLSKWLILTNICASNELAVRSIGYFSHFFQQLYFSRWKLKVHCWKSSHSWLTLCDIMRVSFSKCSATSGLHTSQ